MTRDTLRILLATAVVAVMASAAQAEIVPNLLYYHMDEASWDGTAGEVIDSSTGTKYHGTAAGDATTVADSLFGRAGTFDRSGTADYVDCGTDTGLVSAQITLEACIKLASSGGSTDWKNSRSIISRIDSYFFEVRDHTDGKGRLACYLYGTTGGWLIADTVDMADYIDEWIHVAATFDGSEEVLYINGTEVASVASTGSVDSDSYTTQVGWSAYNRSFDGEMAHVGISNYGLTKDQVEERYNMTIVPEPSAIALLGIGGLIMLIWRRRRTG